MATTTTETQNVPAPVQASTPVNTADSLTVTCGKAKVTYCLSRSRKIKKSLLPTELRRDLPSIGTTVQQLDEHIAALLRVRFALAGDANGKVLTGIALSGGGHTTQENLNAAKRFRDGVL